MMGSVLSHVLQSVHRNYAGRNSNGIMATPI
jgi:hypothetical protein